MAGKPTSESYETLLQAYDYFNHNLFQQQLPPVMITFHRQRKVMGYASIGRWVNEQREYIDELAVNPEYFAKYPLMEICQTLCHEMAHVWQAHYGTPGRRGYHNTQWAQKMTQIGLMPSSTGRPSGQKIGEWMMDYVIYEGAFHKSCKKLLSQGYKLPWVDRYPVCRLELPVLAYDDAGNAIELDRHLEAKTTKVAALKSTHAAAVIKSEALYIPTDDTPWVEPVARNVADFHTHAYTHNADTYTDEAEDNLLNELSSSKPRPKSGRLKYTCKSCHLQIWGKPGLRISCDDCKQPLHEVI